MSNPFHFYTEHHLIKLLGLKARNPAELLDGIKKVPQSSIYYHTHRFLQQHFYLSPEPPNDFAYWFTNVLNLGDLGEAFASVDTVEFRSMEALRNKFIDILEGYTAKNPVVCPDGQEFYFMACKTFILPTQYVAQNLEEFAEMLAGTSVSSLYFHIFEARMRLGRDESDFEAWFKSLGADTLAKELSRLDPYTITLEGLREKIIKMVRKYAEH
ncbi:MAG: DUF5752 family protein [Bacillota bacterium]